VKKEFMESHKNEFHIARMAEALNFSRSGHYARANRKPGKREREDYFLLSEIKNIHNELRGTPGVIKTYNEFLRRSIRVGKNRVHKLMRINGITGIIRGKKKIQTTDSSHKFPASPNLLNRIFSAVKPDKIWVSDITYIRTATGFLYLCVIIDLYSRKVVGWSMKNSLESSLATSALRMAVKHRNPDAELIFHSDRGVQYASEEFRVELKKYGMLQSMSRKGNCWDNAVAESFFSILKYEMEFNVFLNASEARKYIFDFIEVFYNRIRTHSYLGYVSPEEFEKQYVA